MLCRSTSAGPRPRHEWESEFKSAQANPIPAGTVNRFTPVAGAAGLPVFSRTNRKVDMRYLIRLVIPALVFAGAFYLLTRRPRHDGTPRAGGSNRAPRQGSDVFPFLAILVVSAMVALGTAFLLESMWEQQ